MRAPLPFALPVFVALAAAPSGAQDGAPLPSSLLEAAKAATKAPTTPAADPEAPRDDPPPTTPVPAPPAPPATTAATTPGEVKSIDEWDIVELTSARLLPNGQPATDACGYTRDVVAARRSPPARTPAKLTVGCTKGPDGLPAPAPPTLTLPEPYAQTPLDIDNGNITVTVDAGALFLGEAMTGLRRGTLPFVTKCHDMALGPMGTAGFHLEVSPAGRIVGSETYDATLAEPLVLCLKEAVYRATFPSTRDGNAAKVSVFITLRQRKQAESAALKPCKAGETPTTKDGAQTCAVARACAHDEVPKAVDALGPGELPCTIEYVERGVPFLKGELTSFGDVQLVNARNSVGVGLGVNVIDNIFYAVVRPDVNLRFGPFKLGLGAPLRFEVLNLQSIDLLGGDPIGDATANTGRFRFEDWDQVEDFVRPLRYVSWGKKEDNLYVDLHRVHSLSIGNGQLVRRYAPNLDIDQDKVFAQVDGYGSLGGVELMAGPFPVPRLAGGLVFIKPFGVVDAVSALTAPKPAEGATPTATAAGDDYVSGLLRSMSLGFSYVTDLNSPTGLDKRLNPVDQRPQLIVDQAGQFFWSNRANPVGDVVQGMGVDLEAKVLKVGIVDVKVYGDYSHLFFPGDSSADQAFAAFNGGGATVGGLLRMSFGETPVRDIEEEDEATKRGLKPREKKAAHALRARLEGRTFSPTYLPSYWNTMYEVDRFQFGFADDRITLPTKIRYLADQASDPWRVGYYAELSYLWVDVLGVTAMLEDAYALGDSDPVRGKNFAVHAESKGLGWLQFFGTYHFRNFEFAELNRAFSLTSDNEVVFFGARMQLLPILFINLGGQRAFRTAFSADDVLTPNDKGERFTSLGLKNAWLYGMDIELGWQF